MVTLHQINQARADRMIAVRSENKSETLREAYLARHYVERTGNVDRREMFRATAIVLGLMLGAVLINIVCKGI